MPSKTKAGNEAARQIEAAPRNKDQASRVDAGTREAPSRKVRQPIQKLGNRRRFVENVAEDYVPDVFDFERVVGWWGDRMWKLRRNRGSIDYLEKCYFLDGDASADYDNGFLDEVPADDVMRRLAKRKSWDCEESGEQGEERMPECFRYLPRVIGCGSTDFYGLKWVRDAIDACVPAGWSLRYTTIFPVLQAADGTVYEVHPILEKMRRISLNERRPRLFTPLTITYAWYPPSPKGWWMAPWTPKLWDHLRKVASVKLFTSAGVVVLEGKDFAHYPAFDARSSLKEVQKEVLYGFDMRELCSALPSGNQIALLSLKRNMLRNSCAKFGFCMHRSQPLEGGAQPETRSLS